LPKGTLVAPQIRCEPVVRGFAIFAAAAEIPSLIGAPTKFPQLVPGRAAIKHILDPNDLTADDDTASLTVNHPLFCRDSTFGECVGFLAAPRPYRRRVTSDSLRRNNPHKVACYNSPPMEQENPRRRKWLEAAVCLWIVASQVWYYLQFKQQFQSILSLTFRRLWH
jgi:hypothetical protein